jgi:hypothetical protein
MGQSNIAAGATLGSNHNSRGADGEVVMGRGFWPGLCVSIKHNSVFASFSLLNKGDYNYELNIPIPFSLISNDPIKDELIIMPGYWFLYNFYALARNAWKYMDRDKRKYKTPIYEYDYLAPDSVNELLTAREIIAKAVATAQLTKQKKTVFTDASKLLALGENLLSTQTKKEIDALEITVNGFENSKRKVKLIKSYDAYHMFEKIIFIYGIEAALRVTENKKGKNSISTLQQVKLSSTNLTWTNIGGQLIPNKNVEGLLNKIKSGAIESWNQVHAFYETESEKYNTRKDLHALSTLEKLTKKSVNKVSTTQFVNWLDSYLEIKKDITARIHATRAKDYVNPFRKMVYESEEEMNAIVGSLKDNSFIKEQNNALSQLEIEIAALKKELKAK